MVKNLLNEDLTKVEEFRIIYDGPSFQGKFKVVELSTQLKALDNLIQNSLMVLQANRKLSDKTHIEDIFIKLKKGSFEEFISVVLSNEEIRGYLVDLIIFFFGIFIAKKNESQTSQFRNEIRSLLKMRSAKSVNEICRPLNDENDFVKMVYNNEVVLDIRQNQKLHIANRIQEEEDALGTEIIDEEFFGYLSSINIDTKKFRFHINKLNKSAPVKTDLTIEQIKNLLGRRIKIQARVHYKIDEIKKVEILNYEVADKKTLKDF